MLYHYWVRMLRYGIPTYASLCEEWNEMRNERVFTYEWFMEVGDVMHTILRMIHPWFGVIIWPTVRKHALREIERRKRQASIRAEQRAAAVALVHKLKEEGYFNMTIAEQLGIKESSVRSLLAVDLKN